MLDLLVVAWKFLLRGECSIFVRIKVVQSSMHRKEPAIEFACCTSRTNHVAGPSEMKDFNNMMYQMIFNAEN